MSSIPLQCLLIRFVEHGDQLAFAEVVRTAGPLVWRVAMRRLQDPQLAEEAAQNVFIVLARKAPVLAHQPGLMAWLHRAATLEASALARGRRRRTHRLTTMARELTLQTTSPQEISTGGPWLDEGLNRLSTDERSLVIGRFYEGRGLRELAAEIGKSEEAAKKLSQRAMAKLEKFLRGRAAAAAGAAFTSWLGAELSPASLPARMTDAWVHAGMTALSSQAAPSSLLTHLFAAMTASKSTAVATGLFLILLAASYRQHTANAEVRRELSAARTPAAPPAPPKPAAPGAISRSSPRSALTKAGAGLPSPLDAPSLLRSMARANPEISGLYDPGPDMVAAQTVIMSMTPEQKWALWEELQAAEGSPAVLRMAREWVLLHLVKHDPQKVMDLTVAGRFSGHAEASIRSWAAADPNAAWAWLSEAAADGRLLRTRAGGKAPEEILRRGFADGLASLKLSDAVAFTRSRLADEGAEWLVAGTGAHLMKRRDYDTLLGLTAGLPTEAGRVRALVDASRAGFDRSNVMWATATVQPLLDRPDFPAPLRQSVLREVAATAYGDAVWPSLILVHQSSPPDQREEDLVWLAERFQRERPAQLSGFIALADPAQQQALDSALAATSEALARRGNERLAREFGEKIRDPDRRPHAVNRPTP